MTPALLTEAQAALLREAGRRALSPREALSFLGGDRPGRTLASAVRHGWLVERGGVLVLAERGEAALATLDLWKTRREDAARAAGPAPAPPPSPASGVRPGGGAGTGAGVKEPSSARIASFSPPEPRTLQAWLLWYSRDDLRPSHRREAARRRLAALEKAREDEVLTIPTFDPPDPADQRPERSSPARPPPGPSPGDGDGDDS